MRGHIIKVFGNSLILVWLLSNSLIIQCRSHIIRHHTQYTDNDSRDGSPLGLINSTSWKSHRVAGGYKVEEGEFPSFVVIEILCSNKNIYACGGVAIHDRLVLTAAHCVISTDVCEVVRVLAAPSIWHPNSWKIKGVRTYNVKRVCSSPLYNNYKNSLIHDYAVLLVDEPIRGIEAAALTTDSIPIGHQAIAVGIGVIHREDGYEDQYPNQLQALPVKRVDCGEESHESLICFQSYNSKYVGDTCSGDSGGPIYARSKDGIYHLIVGLTSSGLSDVCRKGHHSISINVNVYNCMTKIFDLAAECLRMDP